MLKISKHSVIALAALFGLLTTQFDAKAAGYKSTQIDVAHRQVPLHVHIWYPNEQGGETLALGKNTLFKGVEVQAYSKVKKGKHPLVILSHGSGGNAVGLTWIATSLADQGMIVAATNHPNTTSRNSIPKETLKIWERTEDISAMIDFFETEFVQQEFHPDLEKISTIGFSLGGHSALAIVGAKVSKAKYIQYCSDFAGKLDCGWLSKGGVDFNNIDAKNFERDLRDDRVKMTIAVDPGLAQAFVEPSLTAVDLPAHIINLGLENTVPAGINGSQIAKMVPNSEYHQINEATHFSFLGECTKIGEKIIKEEGEDPICSEVGSRTRANIHQELKRLIGGFYKK